MRFRLTDTTIDDLGWPWTV